jgi:hypothetical protein
VNENVKRPEPRGGEKKYFRSEMSEWRKISGQFRGLFHNNHSVDNIKCRMLWRLVNDELDKIWNDLIKNESRCYEQELL